MSDVKKKCKICNVEFGPRKGNRSLLCRDCYCKRLTNYYHKRKEKVTCICGKKIDKTYFFKHLQSKLHERWLTKKLFFSRLLQF
jgi:uridine kinase